MCAGPDLQDEQSGAAQYDGHEHADGNDQLRFLVFARAPRCSAWCARVGAAARCIRAGWAATDLIEFAHAC